MDGENTMQLVHGLKRLREQDRMTWIEVAHGWVAAPEDVVDALSQDGFYTDDGGES